MKAIIIMGDSNSNLQIMKKRKFRNILFILFYLFILNSCRYNNVNPYNGHWHLISDSTSIDNYYFTLDIEDSVSIINKYDISSKSYDCKKLYHKEDKWIVFNEDFYNFELSLRNDILILKDSLFNYEWVQVNNTYCDKINDAFSLILLEIELDSAYNTKLLDINEKRFSIINIGKLKNGLHESLYINDFDIQLGSGICTFTDIEDFLNAEIEISNTNSDSLSVLINLDKRISDSLKFDVIEKVRKVVDLDNIYMIYIDKKKKTIGYLKGK